MSARDVLDSVLHIDFSSSLIQHIRTSTVCSLSSAGCLCKLGACVRASHSTCLEIMNERELGASGSGTMTISQKSFSRLGLIYGADDARDLPSALTPPPPFAAARPLCCDSVEKFVKFHHLTLLFCWKLFLQASATITTPLIVTIITTTTTTTTVLNMSARHPRVLMLCCHSYHVCLCPCFPMAVYLQSPPTPSNMSPDPSFQLSDCHQTITTQASPSNCHTITPSL